MQIFNSFQDLLTNEANGSTSHFPSYDLQQIQQDLAAAGILENASTAPTAAQIALWIALAAGVGTNDVARPSTSQAETTQDKPAVTATNAFSA